MRASVEPVGERVSDSWVGLDRSEVDIPGKIRSRSLKFGLQSDRRRSEISYHFQHRMTTDEVLVTLPDHLAAVLDDLIRSSADPSSELRAQVSLVCLGRKRDNADGESNAGSTVRLSLLETLSRWASSDAGEADLLRNGLGESPPSSPPVAHAIDPKQYGMVSLLSGTQVYLPPAQRKRLHQAENPNSVSQSSTGSSLPV